MALGTMQLNGRASLGKPPYTFHWKTDPSKATIIDNVNPTTLTGVSAGNIALSFYVVDANGCSSKTSELLSMQILPTEMKFEVPSMDQEGKEIERTPIVMNDVYIHVIGNSDGDVIEKVEEKLKLPVQRSNIERIGSFGTDLNKGLLIQRKQYGGSCIIGHGKIIGDIISNIFK
jgi:hypothetical protein